MISRDLHPDDSAHRRHVVAALKALRVEQGLRLRDVGDHMGVTYDAVSQLERDPRPNGRISTIQRYARAVDHRALLHIGGLPDPEPTDTADLVAHLADSTSPTKADLGVRALTIAQLADIRRQTGRYARDVAAAMGITESTLCQLENAGRDPLLSSYQRYARALGGSVTVTLQPVALEVPA